MSHVSRRALARWAAEQLIAGKAPAGIAKHLAATLVEDKTTSQANFLISDIVWELEQRQVLAIGQLTTATSLPKRLELDLIKQLKKITGADSVILEKKIDKSVLGGLRLETAGQVWDETVVRQLAEIKETV